MVRQAQLSPRSQIVIMLAETCGGHSSLAIQSGQTAGEVTTYRVNRRSTWSASGLIRRGLYSDLQSCFPSPSDEIALARVAVAMDLSDIKAGFVQNPTCQCHGVMAGESFRTRLSAWYYAAASPFSATAQYKT
jgi:hypothetical protein